MVLVALAKTYSTALAWLVFFSFTSTLAFTTASLGLVSLDMFMIT